MLLKKSILLCCVVLLLAACEANQIRNTIELIDKMSNQPVNENTVVAGLKQALEIGTEHAVSQTSTVGGFSENPLIKISTPKELKKLTDTLSKLGFSRQVNNFELMMNRAAETASNEAKTLFIDAIKNMSINDAFAILNGDDHSATNYFRSQTEQSLRARYKPIITNTMNNIGFYSEYRALLETYHTIPFAKKPNLDIEDHIVDQALNGLFTLVANEETKIRRDPIARTTELLRRVFT